MIAADATTVAELNERARSDWIVTGYVTEDGLVLYGGSTVGMGDEVVTRENNRRLATGKGWVKNGDRWRVNATTEDGSMTVKRAAGGGAVRQCHTEKGGIRGWTTFADPEGNEFGPGCPVIVTTSGSRPATTNRHHHSR
jgi:hypothetical protein